MQYSEIGGPTCAGREFLRHRTSFRSMGDQLFTGLGTPPTEPARAASDEHGRIISKIAPGKGTALFRGPQRSIPCPALAMTYTQRYDFGNSHYQDNRSTHRRERERNRQRGLLRPQRAVARSPSYACMLTPSARRHGPNRLHQGRRLWPFVEQRLAPPARRHSNRGPLPSRGEEAGARLPMSSAPPRMILNSQPVDFPVHSSINAMPEFATGGRHGKTQSFRPRRAIGERHAPRVSAGVRRRRDARTAAQSRQGAAELADEPP